MFREQKVISAVMEDTKGTTPESQHDSPTAAQCGTGSGLRKARSRCVRLKGEPSRKRTQGSRGTGTVNWPVTLRGSEPKDSSKEQSVW